MIWRFPEKADAKKVFYAAPAVVNGEVVVGDYANNLYGINAQTGAQNWVFGGSEGAKDRYIASPLAAFNLILAPSADHFLYALNEQGKFQWKFQTGSPIWAQPVSDGKNIFLASMDHNLYKLNPANGSQVWSADLGAAVVYSLTLSQDGSTLYTGTLANEMLAVDAASGKILWRYKTAGTIWAKAVENSNAIFFGDQTGKVYGLSAKEGAKKWELDTASTVIGSGAVIDNGVVFPLENGTALAVDFNGNKLWNQTVNGKLYSNPVYTGGRLILAVTASSDNHLVVSLSPNGTQNWAFIPPK